MNNIIKLIKQMRVMDSESHFKNETNLKYLMGCRKLLELSILVFMCIL